jgi:hypothetical protein
MLIVEAHSTTSLRFDDGSPVRAASAIAPFGSGWLIAQDDATHAAWWQEDSVTPLRSFPSVAGLDLFAEKHGTKRLEPDLEAACAVDVCGTPGTLLLGSGSLPNRTRAALVSGDADRPRVKTADLRAHYDLVGRALGVSAVAEDTDDPVADGPVSAAALAVLDGEEVVAATLLPADVSGSDRRLDEVPMCSGKRATAERDSR